MPTAAGGPGGAGNPAAAGGAGNPVATGIFVGIFGVEKDGGGGILVAGAGRVGAEGPLTPAEAARPRAMPGAAKAVGGGGSPPPADISGGGGGKAPALALGIAIAEGGGGRSLGAPGAPGNFGIAPGGGGKSLGPAGKTPPRVGA